MSSEDSSAKSDQSHSTKPDCTTIYWLIKILMIGGGHAHLGAQKTEDGNIQLPLLLRPAISATAFAVTAAVFAHFVSLNPISLYRKENENGIDNESIAGTD